MNTAQIIDILEELKKNSMFRLSLSSRELFHSNFWAWLMEKYKHKFTTVFYPEYDNISEFEVKREKKHYDLSLEFKDKSKIVIIENKFKATPDKQQLERYFDNAADKQKTEIRLISYLEPNFNTDYISYSDIYEGLRAVDLSDIDPTDRAIIQNYTQCLKLLCELKAFVDTDVKTPDEFWTDYNQRELQKKLDGINFGLTLQRIFLSNIARKLVEKIRTDGLNINFQINTGKSRIAYIDFYIPDTEFLISLYCNGEYRYVFKIKKENGDTREKLIEKCKNKYGRFLSEKNCLETRKEYCCYMGEDAAWVYKKRDCKNKTIFDEIADCVEKDLNELRRIF